MRPPPGKKPAEGVRYHVMPSPIEGVGLFAGVWMEAGEALVDYLGRVVPLDAFGRAPEGVRVETLAELADGVGLDGGVSDNPAAAINHSCRPNCELRREKGTLVIYTARTVAPGEELTLNYGYTAREALGRRCCCGERECCGYQVGEPWRPALFRLLARRRKSRSLLKKGIDGGG